MNENRKSFLIVLDNKKQLLGTFTMGDFRKALYSNAKFNSSIAVIIIKLKGYSK